MSSDARDNSGHRWSGWPGAYCMYCFGEDSREICLGDGHDLDCTQCQNKPCPMPDVDKDAMDNDYDSPPPDVGDKVTAAPQP